MRAALAREVVHRPLTEAGVLTKPGRAYPMCRITILGWTFFIDMDPTQQSLEDLRGVATVQGDPLYVFPVGQAA